MAKYIVYWRAGKEGSPLSGTWYTLGGVITHASPKLAGWIGRRHLDLAAAMASGYTPIPGCGHYRRTPKRVGDACVPNTNEWHNKLRKTTDAVISLLGDLAYSNRK